MYFNLYSLFINLVIAGSSSFVQKRKTTDQLFENIHNITYVSGSTVLPLGCNINPFSMKFGPHHAKAPVTKATQVNPAVDNMKLQLKMNE